MQYILLMNFVITAFFAVVWNGSNWLNFLLKFSLIGVTVFNGVATFQAFGYIVKG